MVMYGMNIWLVLHPFQMYGQIVCVSRLLVYRSVIKLPGPGIINIVFIFLTNVTLILYEKAPHKAGLCFVWNFTTSLETNETGYRYFAA